MKKVVSIFILSFLILLPIKTVEAIPIEDFDFSPGYPQINETVNFDGSASYDTDAPDKSLIVWDWYIDNDGEFDDASGEAVEFVYVEIDPPPNPIPEPATIFLLGTGLIGISVIGKKRLLIK